MKSFSKKFFQYLDLDLAYSTNHDLSPSNTYKHIDNNIQDPHFLKSQMELRGTFDSEESIGSIDEYNKYKGNVVDNGLSKLHLLILHQLFLLK